MFLLSICIPSDGDGCQSDDCHSGRNPNEQHLQYAYTYTSCPEPLRVSCHLEEALLLIKALILCPEIFIDDLVWSAKFIHVWLVLSGPGQLHMTIDPKRADLLESLSSEAHQPESTSTIRLILQAHAIVQGQQCTSKPCSFSIACASMDLF